MSPSVLASASFVVVQPSKDLEHEVPGDGLERLDTRRQRAFDALALEGSFAEDRITNTCSLGRHEDDDAIVLFDFQ